MFKKFKFMLFFHNNNNNSSNNNNTTLGSVHFGVVVVELIVIAEEK